MQQRFLRTELLLGKDNLKKLNISKVLVVGLGGVGSYTVEALARSGVMNFTLIDSDTFEETNLNRQLYCTKETIGKYKTLVTKDRILSIDNNIQVLTYEEFVTPNNIDSFLKVKYDLVIDAIDTIDSKCSFIEYCIKNDIKIISSMGAGFRIDPTQIRIADISNTFGDPLAKRVRQSLSKLGISKGFNCVFSAEKPIEHDDKIIASIASVTGSMGLALAQLAINTLINN